MRQVALGEVETVVIHHLGQVWNMQAKPITVFLSESILSVTSSFTSL